MFDFNSIDMSKLDLSSLNNAISNIHVPDIHFDEKNTVQYKIKEQTEQLLKSHQQQIELLNEQNQKSNQQIRLLY